MLLNSRDGIFLSAVLRARLFEAARASFLADDYHSVSTRHIAEKAGANVSMIHHYFGSKEGLVSGSVQEPKANGH